MEANLFDLVQKYAYVGTSAEGADLHGTLSAQELTQAHNAKIGLGGEIGPTSARSGRRGGKGLTRFDFDQLCYVAPEAIESV
jgi:hypothetical protein